MWHRNVLPLVAHMWHLWMLWDVKFCKLQISARSQGDRTMKKLMAAAAFLSLTGCQAMMFGTADDLNKVQIGMTKDQVIAAIGKPNTIAADASKHEESLSYKRMPAVVGWLPAWYDVVLVDGKVARYGEHKD